MSYYELERNDAARSRKNWRCTWCGEWIPSGETHQKCVLIFDGEFQKQRWHHECWAAFQNQFKHFHAGVLLTFNSPQPRGGCREDSVYEI